MNVQEARINLTNNLLQSVRENDSLTPCEADERVNNASRHVVQVMANEHGEAWLGKINLYGEERHGGHPIMWQWNGELVYNFGAAFVSPKHDDELVRLVKERDDAEYTGTADDIVRLEKIYKRLNEIGGVHLYWT